MHIALTADPELPVPPRLYGGIERVVDILAKGLVERGHEVTLFAHPESRSAGNLVTWPGSSSRSLADTARNAATLAREILRRRVDIVHSFSRIAYLSALLPLSTPKVMSYQRAISPRTTRLGHSLSRGTLSFTAISEWMMRNASSVGRWDLVPNGVDLAAYDFVSAVPADAPLVFLGRIEEIKGPHLAIEIARKSGRRLVIAGNIPEEKRVWVESLVMPHVDGQHVSYIGPVDDTQKNILLGSAAALLMPILWDEPFGIVMAEALACGTPVVGLNRGAVPEVVQDGITGYVREHAHDLIRCVSQLSGITRSACRQRAETYYSKDAIVEGYLKVYHARLNSRPSARRTHST